MDQSVYIKMMIVICFTSSWPYGDVLKAFYMSMCKLKTEATSKVSAGETAEDNDACKG